MEKTRRRETASHLKVVDATNLAAQGKFRCNACKQVKPLNEGIVTMAAGTVLYSLCLSPQCFPKQGIAIQDVGGGRLQVGPLRKAAERPPDILVVPNMGAISKVVPPALKPTFKKREM